MPHPPHRLLQAVLTKTHFLEGHIWISKEFMAEHAGQPHHSLAPEHQASRLPAIFLMYGPWDGDSHFPHGLEANYKG